MATCPRCGNDRQEFLAIDTGMRVALSQTGQEGGLPDQVCGSCYEELARQVSMGVKLRMEQQAKEKNREVMWKNRVDLVKKARSLMAAKAFPEAALNYEKYLRVLEIVYEKPPGALTPELFANSARAKELTILVTVYWDLFRIYDTSSAYADRMASVSDKLSQFVRYTPLYPDIVRRAEGFVRKAKHPQVVKAFLKKSKESSGRCFIVTATMGYPEHATVLVFRKYRDDVLQRYLVGRLFIQTYYQLSPGLAKWIGTKPALQAKLRPWFQRLANLLVNDRR